MRLTLITFFLAICFQYAFSSELKLESHSFIKTIDYSVTLYNLKQKQLIVSKNINDSFIPASLTKLIITAAIIDKVNLKHRFKTPVYIDKHSPPNLYIQGVGDPNISRRQLANLASKVKKRGYNTFNSVVFDESLISTDVNAYTTSARYYYALSGSLNTNYNQFKLEFNDFKKELTPTPNLNYIDLDFARANLNQKKKKPSHPFISLAKRKHSDKYFFSGEISKGDELNNNLKLRVSRPTSFFYSQLNDVFDQNKVTILNSYEKTGFVKKGKKKVFTFISEPISESLIKLNQQSENMLGNLLFKYLGLLLYNAPGDEKKGRKAVDMFMHSRFSIPKFIEIRDGSGLSKYSKVTSKFINDVLIYFYKKQFKFSKRFLLDLSKSEDYKSLKIPKHLSIYAKSGTLAQNGVNNLAGFIQNNATKDVYSFAILTKTKDKKFNPVYKGTHTIPLLNELIKTL